MAREGYISMRS